MPRLGFYAATEDFLPVLEIAFEECRVFEHYSVPDEPLRSYWNPTQVRDAFERRGEISRRINRRIASLAVGKSGSQPILPGADALVKSGAAVLVPG